MRQAGYLVHLLFWLAFVVGVRFAMTLCSDWLAGLILLPLPFYLIHDRVLWRRRRERGPLYAAWRYTRLTIWHRGRRAAEPIDALPHKPHGYCPKCGYHLHVGRCPECGHEVTHDNILAEPSGLFRRHRRKLIAACMLALICAGGHFAMTHIRWMAKLPTRYVLTLYDWGYKDAEYEMERRINSEKTQPDELKLLLAKAIVPALSVPARFPRDTVTPCNFRFRGVIGNVYADNYCYIENWRLELDGRLIKSGESQHDPTWAYEGLFYRLPTPEPGEHVVRMYGELVLTREPYPEPLTKTAICTTPFECETTYTVENLTAAEMIPASPHVLPEGKRHMQPLRAYTRHASWYEEVDGKRVPHHTLTICRNEDLTLSADIAGAVFARPRGRGEYVQIGFCYIKSKAATLEISQYAELLDAEELDVRIVPDARQAAYFSKMKCRRYYDKPVDIVAPISEWVDRS